MMNKFVLLISIFIFGLSGAQTLTVLKKQKFDTGEKFKSHRYGGISGLSFSDGFLWGISDDRGQFGSPRFYKHSLKDQSVKIEEEMTLKEPAEYPVLDLEAIHRFKDGRFLISSEGDLNKKPRVLPFVRFWNKSSGTEKAWGLELPIPEDFLPEKIGMQTKGLQNNSAFEGVTVGDDEKTIYLLSELPLYQSQTSELEFLEFDLEGADWKLRNRKPYKRDLPISGVLEVMRGVSEILYWKKDTILVLERYVHLSQAKALDIGAELFSVNLADMSKKKLFTLDGELNGNWEGMTWGPDLSDGRKQLILVTDNNFEKHTPTEYLFLAFKEEKK